MMIWLVMVPEPAKELMNSTGAPPSAAQTFWKAGKTAPFSVSPRMLKP
jgi:hypothetical protein